MPFDSETIGNPALDIGDVISFSGGHADDTQIAAITGMTVKINGKTTLKCVGKNPRLSQAKSKNDKNIAGLLNSVEVGKITVHSYMNSSPFTVGENDAEIVSLEFASQDDTDAEFHGSILIDIDANAYNTFKVRLSVTGGSGFIDRMQALCTISGQGLSAGNVWDGRLSFEEKFVPVADVGSLSFRKAIDIVEPYTEVPESIGLVDTFTPARFGRLTALRFIAEPQMNPVVVTETIEPADRNEMTFNRQYVWSETTFKFQTDYSFTNYEVLIDEGRMSRIEINTEQFARIDSLEVKRSGDI